MRLWLPVVYFISFTLCSLATTTADVWRPPQPVPEQCSELRFEVLLIDVSRPMLRFRLFQQAQENAADYILTRAPACTLAIVGSFGVTADVRSGEFLVDLKSRMRLVESIRALRATHGYTNRDEAAKLIALLDYELRDAYGVPADLLIVRAYTDYESRPYGDKAKFSLAEYLALRMNARHIRVVIGDKANGQRLKPQPTAQKIPKPKESARAGWYRRLWIGSILLAGVALLSMTFLGFWLRSRASPHASPPLGEAAGQDRCAARVGHGVPLGLFNAPAWPAGAAADPPQDYRRPAGIRADNPAILPPPREMQDEDVE